MFHTVQWSSEHSKNTPPLKAIQIWAHLTGVPLDLRHTKGLSLVVGLVGEPKETDEFTRNLVSLTLSHVKVEVDLTKPLLSIVEFERESGEVVEVAVHYPWVPPTCSHCHELGHIIRNCLLYTPPQADTAATGKKGTKTPAKSTKKYQPVANVSQSTSAAGPNADQTVHLGHKDTLEKAPLSTPMQKVSTMNRVSHADPLKSLAEASDPMETSKIVTLPPIPKSSNPFSTPDPLPRPSLKRSRSSPTLSPPQTSNSNTNPNPFLRPKAPLKAILSSNSGSPASSINAHPHKTLFFSSNSFALLDPPILSGDPSNLF